LANLKQGNECDVTNQAFDKSFGKSE
jgi:hypothetical protein